MPEPADAPPDVVRLTLPPDGDLAPVLEVAMAVLGRRQRLADTVIEAGRAAISAAFAEVAQAVDPHPVEVELAVEPGRLQVRLRGGGADRTVTLPAVPHPPG